MQSCLLELTDDMANAAELTRVVDTLVERVNNYIKFFWTVVAFAFIWLGAISGVLLHMNANIDTLRVPQKLEQFSLNPQDRNSQEQAASILAQAQSNRTKLPESTVERAGVRFIEASAKVPEAWGIALHFLDYRSSLNVYLRVVKTVSIPAGTAMHFNIGPAIDGKDIPNVSFVEAGVSALDAARFETIGNNLNEQLPAGAPELIARGGAISLDDKYLRHVMLDGVEIHYTGKPVIMEDVVFINCTFIMDNTDRSRKLGQTLLASSVVDFRNAT
jgi:hypothetical protein